MEAFLIISVATLYILGMLALYSAKILSDMKEEGVDKTDILLLTVWPILSPFLMYLTINKLKGEKS